jgi:membrane-associated phospholipid phosphatase
MRRSSASAPAVLLACAGLLLVTVAAVRWWAGLRDLDLQAFDAVSGAPADGVVRVVAGIADPLPFVVLAAALAGVALARGRLRAALAIVTILALAALTTEGLKRTLDQGTLHGGAFPSGHTTAAVALVACLVIALPGRRRRVALVAGGCAAAAVGVATVLLGWHTPSDVVGGALVAGTVTAGVVTAVSGSGSSRARSRASRPRG